MKKGLFIILLVLMSLFIFVGCCPEKELPNSVSFKRTTGSNSCVLTLNNDEGKTGTYEAFVIFQGSEISQNSLDITFDDTTGVITFTDDSSTLTFYKSENTNAQISSMEELFISLTDIYAYDEEWLKYSKVVE